MAAGGVSRLTGRCTSCPRHGVVFHDERNDVLLCERCIGEVLDRRLEEAAGPVPPPDADGLYEGSLLVEWMACHVDRRRYVRGCPYCRAGRVGRMGRP